MIWKPQQYKYLYSKNEYPIQFAILERQIYWVLLQLSLFFGTELGLLFFVDSLITLNFIMELPNLWEPLPFFIWESEVSYCDPFSDLFSWKDPLCFTGFIVCAIASPSTWPSPTYRKSSFVTVLWKLGMISSKLWSDWLFDKSTVLQSCGNSFAALFFSFAVETPPIYFFFNIGLVPPGPNGSFCLLLDLSFVLICAFLN